MAIKPTVPRPDARRKVQPARNAANAAIRAKPAAATATSPPPPLVAKPAAAKPAVAKPVVAEPAVAEPAVAEPGVAEPAVAEPGVAEQVPPPSPAPPPAVVAARPRFRSLAESLPSDYERDSRRKSSPPVLARRKRLTRVVVGAVGVAWFICLLAVSRTAVGWVVASAGHAGDTRADVSASR